MKFNEKLFSGVGGVITGGRTDRQALRSQRAPFLQLSVAPITCGKTSEILLSVTVLSGR